MQAPGAVKSLWLRRLICLSASAAGIIGGCWVVNSGYGEEYATLYGFSAYVAGWLILRWLR